MSTCYFLAKCINTHILTESQLKNEWSLPIRKCEPQAYDIVNERFNKGDTIVFIVSVTGTKKHQGFFEMKELVFLGEDEEKNVYPNFTKNFKVEWKCQYPNECIGLSFEKTEHLINPLTNLSVNKSRNIQEISPDVGEYMCCLLKEDTEIEDNKVKDKILQHKLQSIETPFHEIYQQNPEYNNINHNENILFDIEFEKECNATLIDHSPESYNLIKNKIKDYISQSESYKSFISSEQPVGIHLTAVLPYEYAQKN